MDGDVVLVAGATGELGGLIVRGLLAEGRQVRALVRPVTDATALVAAGAQVVRGDLRDLGSLSDALVGVGTVVTTVTAITRIMTGPTDLTIAGVDGDGNLNLIRAADRAGVRRFVFVSAAGMGDEMARLSPMMAGKWEAEKLLATTSMRRVVVRPDMFQEAWLGRSAGFVPGAGRMLVYGRGRTPHRYVAMADVATLCVRLATMDEPPRLVEFGGPDAHTVLDVVHLYEQAARVRVRVRHVPRFALSVGRRATARLRPGLSSLMGLALNGDLHAATWDDQPLRDAGIAPRSVRAFVEASVAGDRPLGAAA